MTDPNAGYGFGFSSSHSDPNSSKDFSPLYPHHPASLAEDLITTANAIVNPRGKGIYATDETPEGIEGRLVAAAGAEGNQKTLSDGEKTERRKAWRKTLYETLPTEYISAVILHSETLNIFSLAPLLTDRGIIPGIRADTDSHPLPASPSEPATQGLDDLLPRMVAAHKAGARFSKWRAPILLNSSTLPTQAALEAQAESLARFAATSQQAGLVPIVEPDVDFSGDASLERSVEIHVKIISMIYARCFAHGVLVEGTLIKPSFAQPGLKHPSRETTTAEEVASATAAVLARTLPIGVAGVVFLSGGLPDKTAVAYLNALNVLKNTSTKLSKAGQYTDPIARLPPLTFSFGRGLQEGAMRAWVKGDTAGAREAFERRGKECWLASKGELGGT